MTQHRPDITGLVAGWATDLQAEIVADLPATQVWAVADAAVGMVGVVPIAILEGGMTMTTTSIGAAAATGIKAKIVAGTLAAALTAGGAAAATGTLPDGTQSFVANVAGSVGLDLPRPETTIDLFANVDVVADEFITVSTVGQVGVALDGGALVLTDIMGNAGVTASIVVETADSVIVEFVSEAEVATVVISRAGEEIVSDISRTAFEVDSGTGLIVETPIGTAETTGSGSSEGTTDSGNTTSNESSNSGAVVGGELDATVEQCVAVDAAGDLGLGFSAPGVQGTLDASGSTVTEACVEADASAEGTATVDK